MAYVICEPCIGTKYGACMAVCPFDGIAGDEEGGQHYIDPDLCLDCGVCKTECPVEAIYADHKVPPQWRGYIALNASYFRGQA